MVGFNPASATFDRIALGIFDPYANAFVFSQGSQLDVPRQAIRGLKQIFVNLPVDGLGTVVWQRAERRVPYGHVNGKGCNPQIDRQEPEDESPPKEG